MSDLFGNDIVGFPTRRLILPCSTGKIDQSPKDSSQTPTHIKENPIESNH